ncbi:MAG TPA: hypothetical protein PK156_50160, partial [Polyangium sp.]|nr:hypothetical protein [Polyangium sp.]
EMSYNPDYALALPAIMDTRLGPSALPNAGWYTNAMIQNASDLPANIKITATWKQGAGGANPDAAVTFSLQPHESIVFRIDNPGIAGTIGIPEIANKNFEGSLMLESDQRVAVVTAVANIPLAPMGVSGGAAKGFYVGQSLRSNGWETGQALIYPTFKSGFNGKSSTLFVQNTTNNSGMVTIEVRTNAGNKYIGQISLDSRRSAAIHPSDLRRDTDGSPMPSGCSGPANTTGGACFGSVTVQTNSANLRVAAVATEHVATSTGPLTQILANTFHKDGNFASEHKHRYCAPFKNLFQSEGTRTGIAIMNLSPTNADIAVTLKGLVNPANPASGNTYSYVFRNVPGRTSVVASPYAGNEYTIGGFPVGGLGAVSVDSTHPILAVVSDEDSSLRQTGFQCSSFPKDKLLAPQVKFAYPSATSSGAANTEIYVQNMGTQSAMITATYTCRIANSSVFTTYVTTKSAEAGGAALFSRGNVAVPDGRLCSVSFTSPNPIMIGTATETTRGLAIPQVDDATYELFSFD